MNAVTLSRKHNDILAAAKKLFWKYGYKKVSIEEICSEAKVSKVTFYKFYPNKIELAKTILDNVVKESIIGFKDLQENAVSASDLMEGMLKMKKEGINDISKEFLADFYSDKELGLGEYVAVKTLQVQTEMISDFKKLQERGLLRKDMSIEFVLYISGKMSSFTEDPYLLSLFPNPEDLVMEFTNFVAYGMSPTMTNNESS